MTAPTAHIVHSMPGRTRLRIPERRHDQRYFSRVQSRLEKVPGVKSVVVNALTGSILILHDLAADELKRHAEDNGLFRVISEIAQAIPLSERLSGHFEAAGNTLQNATGGSLDGKGVLILALAIAGGLQLLRKKALPEGTTLLWYATSLLREKHPARQ